LEKQLPGKLYLFAIGVFIAKNWGEWAARRWLLWAVAFMGIAAVPILVLLKPAGVMHAIVMACLCTSIVCLCLVKWVKFELPDYSYTLYLIHYPILVLAMQFFQRDTSYFLVYPVCWTFIAAAAIGLSHLVERPALLFARNVLIPAQRRGARLPALVLSIFR
jgi:peptidoglycan/LPS O-acetylase OafA/YrhL